MLYNSLLETDNTDQGIESFIAVHTNLMTLHGFMAGFQYVAFDPQLDSNDGKSDIGKWVFGIRYFGLTLSLFGVVISLITIEFLKSSKSEPLDLVVEAVLDYASFFLMSDYLAVLATFMIGLAVNVLIYESLRWEVCLAFNFLTAVGCVGFLFQFWKMILGRQNYGNDGRHIYGNEEFKLAIADQNDIRTRLWRFWNGEGRTNVNGGGGSNEEGQEGTTMNGQEGSTVSGGGGGNE
jgi:hypothetical protein